MKNVKLLSSIHLFIDIIIPAISSTQTECDVMCAQYVQKQPLELFFKKICS